jgi:hypothetical protein
MVCQRVGFLSKGMPGLEQKHRPTARGPAFAAFHLLVARKGRDCTLRSIE